MKKTRLLPLLIGSLYITLFLAACSKNSDTPDTPLDDPDLASAKVLAEGTLTGSGNYQVSGRVAILDSNGVKILRFENFNSSNGPDLKVYLSRDAAASRFISLGKLKSVSGNQNYNISGMPDLMEYPYVLVWCERFGVLFGSANLK